MHMVKRYQFYTSVSYLHGGLMSAMFFALLSSLKYEPEVSYAYVASMILAVVMSGVGLWFYARRASNLVIDIATKAALLGIEQGKRQGYVEGWNAFLASDRMEGEEWKHR